MDVVAIIPARYSSSRFPGKPLVDIAGKTMIQRVYERALAAQLVERVIVATDDERIAAAVAAFGGEVQMTAAEHETGTDRLAEVAATLDAQLIVNVQGDEPLIDPATIDMAVEPLLRDTGIAMGTLMSAIDNGDDYFDPNVVKVVVDRDGNALYFSRAPIPCVRDAASASAAPAFRHIGLYVYRRDFLLRYPRLESTVLEQAEKLEQLRALEHGYRIHVECTRQAAPGVDTPEDLEKVRRLLAQQGEV